MRIVKPFIVLLATTSIALCVLGQGKHSLEKKADSVAPKIDSLQAVMVTASTRIRAKGDTMEYNTEHIILRTNAVVEDALRQLPGLVIDAQGNIIYNGQRVEHLLIDGQDVFGSDPTMITRIFAASKVAKIQIIDRKSDQAVFTGIDDGVRTKTLNLLMKESAKDGYFGKAEAGVGMGGYYNGDAALAEFKGKQQFTALGFVSNTGALGFSSSAGGQTSTLNFLNWNQDILGASAGAGIPQLTSAAMHYGNAGTDPQKYFEVNYQYGKLFSEPTTITQTKQIQPDRIYSQYQQSHSANDQFQHWIYGNYEFMTGKSSAFKIKFYAIHVQAANQFNAVASDSFNDTLVNSSARNIHDKLIRENLGTDLSWRIQVGKRTGRTFSATAGFQRGSDKNDGYIYSLNTFYQPDGTVERQDTVDQRKQITDAPLRASFAFTLAEPIWFENILGLSGGVAVADDKPVQNTFDKGGGKYKTIVDSLSNQLTTKAINQFATMTLQGKFNRVTYMLANSIYRLNYSQNDELTHVGFGVQFVDWAPRVNISFHINPSVGFNFIYNTSIQDPSPMQLRPVINNSDPLHVTLGNPNLRPGNSQTLRLDFYHFKAWIINVGVNAVITGNSISTRTMIDSLGRQFSQPLNVTGGGEVGLNLSVTRKVLGFDLGFHHQSDYSRTVSYVNSDLSQNYSRSAGGGFSINKYNADKYALQFYTNFVYFDQCSNINPNASVHYWSQSHMASVSLFFINNLEINTNAVYTWQQKTSAFMGNTTVLLWNTYVSRNFSKNRLVAKIQLSNILNENAGVTRTNAANINMQTSTNILGRYWMLSLAWHLDRKFNKK